MGLLGAYACPLCGWEIVVQSEIDERRIANHAGYHDLMEDRPDPADDQEERNA